MYNVAIKINIQKFNKFDLTFRNIFNNILYLKFMISALISFKHQEKKYLFVCFEHWKLGFKNSQQATYENFSKFSHVSLLKNKQNTFPSD